MSGELSLAELLTRSIRNSNTVLHADSPNDPATQALLQATLSDLTLCDNLINRLGILSPNESLDDINTRDLRCLLVPSLIAQLELLVKTKSGRDRLEWLNRAKVHFERFVKLVEQYEIVPEQKKGVFKGPGELVDPGRRRQSKIAQYKMEKEIKAKLEELRLRRRSRRSRLHGSTTPASTSSFTSSSTASGPTPSSDDDDDDDDEDDDDSDDIARPLLLNLLLLHYLTAHSELSSISSETELLQSGIAMSDLDVNHGDRGTRGREVEDDLTWRVEDVSLSAGREGPLLDPKGRVLRPFTILPSSKDSTSAGLSTRLRFQSAVFGPSHRLPTMTLDEFLDLEQERGNILQGGGPASSDAVDQARNEEKGEKEEDNLGGFEQGERELRKEREHEEWRDTHRRGEGNMLNRG